MKNNKQNIIKHIVCSDELEIDDLHELFAYKINPILSRILNKYYDYHGKEKIRRLLVYMYESSKATPVIYEYQYDPIQALIDYIYKLRDMVLSRSLTLYLFRKYIMELIKGLEKENLPLAYDLLEILKYLGCSIKGELYLDIENGRLTFDKVASILDGINIDEFIKVDLVIYKHGVPQVDKNIKISYRYQYEKGEVFINSKLRSNKLGVVSFIAPKNTNISVDIDEFHKEITTENHDTKIVIDLGFLKSYEENRIPLTVAQISRKSWHEKSRSDIETMKEPRSEARSDQSKDEKTMLEIGEITIPNPFEEEEVKTRKNNRFWLINLLVLSLMLMSLLFLILSLIT